MYFGHFDAGQFSIRIILEKKKKKKKDKKLYLMILALEWLVNGWSQVQFELDLE
jgi:hypothetical protein